MPQSSRPLVVAHRGASAQAPANSAAAFRRAIELGADLIEFDVRRAGDGSLLVVHDRAVGGVPVAELTPAAIAARTGRTPLRLGEVLALAGGRIGVDVELKEPGCAADVLSEVGDPGGFPAIVLTTFLDGVIAECKDAAPGLRAGLLLGPAPPHRALASRADLDLVARARACGADFVAPHVLLTRLGALRRAAAAGLPAYVWTVNEPAALRRLMADPRVEALITDVPDRALGLRGELSRRRSGP